MRAPTSAAALPSYLTQLNLHFDFSAAGVYRKFKASTGDEIALTTDCATVVPTTGGCYYTLIGVVERSSGQADRAIQPFFIYNSQLVGTSQHGVLWKGGEYLEEASWVPVKALGFTSSS